MDKTFFDRVLKDRPLREAMGLTALVLVEAIQFLIILALIYSFIPVPLADFFKDLPPKLQATVHPKREIFFYRCFLVFAVAAQAAFAFWFQHFKKEIPYRELLKAAAVDTGLIFIELFAVFKIWQYDNPWWARDLLYGGIVAWVLVRIFWGECQQGVKIISEVVMEKQRVLRWCIDGVFAVLLISCLWVPDVQKALGRVFVWEQFRNWDAAIMMPGWAYLNHDGLNSNIYSPWGMGAVIFISRCARALGGFDYAHVLTVLMAMVIVYYGFLYIFLRAWLRSVLLAAATVAVAVKVQMFHTGISPLIWAFPQDTPVRHWLDLPALWFLWRHSRSSRRKYLDGAACWIGAALAWSLTAGLCLLAAFWGYLFFLSMLPEYRLSMFSTYKKTRGTIFSGLVPLCVMVLLLFVLQGSAVLQASFWRGMAEPIGLFLQGTGTLSFYTCLYDRHFFAFIAGFVIPVIYLWTLIIITGLGSSKQKLGEDNFLVPLCIYGLGLYLHYLARSSTSHYYAVGVPVVMVLGFWASKWSGLFPPAGRWKIMALSAAAAWAALLTNNFFIYYPNIFDISRNDWNTEISLYQSAFKFDQDAGLIARLTPQGQRAAVISSFETQLLMQANRKPFFYYAPLVNSELSDVNGFAGTSLITQQRLEKTANQMTAEAPEYIFVEKRLLGTWPPAYAQYYSGIAMALRYVTEHYIPQEQGQHLIVMHKKI
jgi:hypothetical protein